MTKSKFSDLGLAEPIQRALTARNHVIPTPIQARAIPELLDGRNLLGIAQTGTGKTAAFALPILQRLSEKRPDTRQKGGRRDPRALILAPTRELAIQIGEEFRAYSKHLPLRQTLIYGGVSQKAQVAGIARGVDILVATPGRLLDLMNQRRVRLDSIECVVLDEADRMLDMGFIRDVRKIVAALPKKRQSLLFSATMPREITHLADEILTDPVRIEVAPQATPIERIEQKVHHVAAGDKIALLADLFAEPALSRVIVFTRTKHRANKVAAQLDKIGVDAEAIHGNKSQGARQRALKSFRDGNVRALVATDIAARGIDVDGVTHVINFELPNEPESYVHRIGRTARAGADGVAVSFCDPAERAYLRDIERLIKCKLTEIGDAPEGAGAERQGVPKKAANKTRSGTRSNKGLSKKAKAKRAQARQGEQPSKANPNRRRRRNAGKRRRPANDGAMPQAAA